MRKARPKPALVLSPWCLPARTRQGETEPTSPLRPTRRPLLSGCLADVEGAGRAARGAGDPRTVPAPAGGEKQPGSRRTHLGGTTFMWNQDLVRPASEPRKSHQKAVA